MGREWCCEFRSIGCAPIKPASQHWRQLFNDFAPSQDASGKGGLGLSEGVGLLTRQLKEVLLTMPTVVAIAASAVLVTILAVHWALGRFSATRRGWSELVRNDLLAEALAVE